MLKGFYVIPRIGGLAYLNMPKAACSSILYGLAQMRNDGKIIKTGPALEDGSDPIHGFHPPHAHFEYFFRRWPLSYPSIPSEMIRFTLVRNPYERVYSFFKSKIQNSQNPGKFYNRFGIEKGCSFLDCIKILTSIDPHKLEHHALPQSMLIYQNDTLYVDYVGKVESITEDWQVIQDLSGFRQDLTKANTSAGDINSAYTPELKQYVYEYYRSDFEIFGYDKNSILENEPDTAFEMPKLYTNHCFAKPLVTEIKKTLSRTTNNIARLADDFKHNPKKRDQFIRAQDENLRELMQKAVHYQQTK